MACKITDIGEALNVAGTKADEIIAMASDFVDWKGNPGTLADAIEYLKIQDRNWVKYGIGDDEAKELVKAIEVLSARRTVGNDHVVLQQQ